MDSVFSSADTTVQPPPFSKVSLFERVECGHVDVTANLSVGTGSGHGVTYVPTVAAAYRTLRRRGLLAAEARKRIRFALTGKLV